MALELIARRSVESLERGFTLKPHKCKTRMQVGGAAMKGVPATTVGVTTNKPSIQGGGLGSKAGKKDNAVEPKTRRKAGTSSAGCDNVRLTVPGGFRGREQFLQQTPNARRKLVGSTGHSVGPNAFDIAKAQTKMFGTASPSGPQTKIGETGLGDLQTGLRVGSSVAEQLEFGINVPNVNVQESCTRNAVGSKAMRHAGRQKGRTQFFGRNGTANCDRMVGLVHNSGARKDSLEIEFPEEAGGAPKLSSSTKSDHGVWIGSARPRRGLERKMLQTPTECNGRMIGRFNDWRKRKHSNAKQSLKMTDGANLGLAGRMGLRRPGIENVNHAHAFQSQESMVVRIMT